MRALLNSHVIGPSQLLHTLVTYGPSGNVAILGPVAAGTDLPDLPRVFVDCFCVFGWLLCAVAGHGFPSACRADGVFGRPGH